MQRTRYIQTLFILFLFFCIHLHPCFHEPKTPYLLRGQVPLLVNEKAPTIVFGEPETLYIKTGKPLAKKNQAQYAFHPIVHKKNNDYLFYPNLGPAFMSILRSGWSIAFFTQGLEHGPEKKLFTQFLKQVLEPYSDAIETEYALLKSAKRIQFFATKHMKEGILPIRGHEQFGHLKKDLTVVSPDNSENTILVESNRSFIPYNQYPYIGISPETDRSLKLGTIQDNQYSFINNASYILGIVSECNDQMKKNQTITARTALDKVLRKKNYTLTHKDFFAKVPWILDPYKEYQKYNNIIDTLITLGNSEIAKITPLAIQRSLLQKMMPHFEQKAPYHVVFDIDDTLCIRLDKKYTKETINSLFCNIDIIDFEYENKNTPHLFFPYFGELFLTILNWGWSVDFFSAAQEERNTRIIPAFLQHAFKKYSHNPQEDIAYITKTGRLHIFSSHHLRDAQNEFIAEKYKYYGQKKKTLSTILPETKVENVILVEDDPSYVDYKEYPYIDVSDGTKFKILLSHLEENNDAYALEDAKEMLTFLNKDKYHELNQAPYILGILSDCKKLLDTHKATSLKNALDITLKKSNYSLLCDFNPWIQSSNQHANQDLESSKIKGWIAQGHTLIQKIRNQNI